MTVSTIAAKTPSKKSAVSKVSKPKAPVKKSAGKVSAAKNEEVLAKMPVLDSAPADIDPVQREGEQAASVESQKSQNAMAFAVQQLTTPSAPATVAPTAEQLKRQEYEVALKELAAKFGQPMPNTRLSSSATKDTQNGVTRPSPETKCGKIWAAADSLSSDAIPASIAALKLHSACAGVNEHTVKTQYARWRSYNGVKGRIVPTGTIVPEQDAEAAE